MQGYLEVSELLLQWKDIKSCFRALFPKLCLEGYWTENSGLANLRWPSSLATKYIDLTACHFSTDNLLILSCLYLSRGSKIHLSLF